MSGDGGRDAALLQPQGETQVVLQYSVSRDWERKIKDTAAKIRDNFPQTTILVYVSPHEIGPKGDAIKGEIRTNYHFSLEIRDRSYFLTRESSTNQTLVASEEVSRVIVDPYLSSEDFLQNKLTVLSTHEARAAVVYLGMQFEDESSGKGLTKLCFEGLVRAVLRDTSPSNLMTRADIHERIKSVVPSDGSHVADSIDAYIDSALSRMERRYIRYHKRSDEFCLSYEERSRISTRLAEFESLDLELMRQIRDLVESTLNVLGMNPPTNLEESISRVRRVLECILVERGEAFVEALRSGSLNFYSTDEIREAVVRDIAAHSEKAQLRENAVSIISHSVETILLSPSSGVLEYLNKLADAYTLFALVRATPNVQASILKLFSDGEIWLDTSVLIPLLSETLVDEPERSFSRLLLAAQTAGVKFFITDGVLEELEVHTYSCLRYVSGQGNRPSRPPGLYRQYLVLGGDPLTFAAWMENFRGPMRPKEDIAEFLKDALKISIKNLDAEVNKASEELRIAVFETWYEIQERRFADRPESDPSLITRMAKHDAENYLGVIERRGHTSSGPFGFRVWWLTLDSQAYTVPSKVAQRLGGHKEMGPMLSPDFLRHYLAISDVRHHLDKGTENALPLMIQVGSIDVVEPELLEVALKVRSNSEGLPPRVIQRNIREAIEIERLRLGTIAKEHGIH
jgi:hypothetical protein